MAMPALPTPGSGAAAPATTGNVIVSFRVGKCAYDGRKVVPDKRKGKLVLCTEDDDLTHVKWQDRTSGTVEDDLIVIQDAYLEKIDKCKDGRVYVLRLTSSNKKLLFWMQEPDASGDEALVKQFNEHIGCERPATPAPGAAGTTPAAATAPAVGAPAAAPAAAVLGAAPGGAPIDPNLNQALASILQNFAAGQGGAQQQIPVLFGDMFEKEDLLALMDDPEAAAELKGCLADGAEKTDDELRQTLISAQVSGSLKQLSQVVYSDQVRTLFAAMGLDQSHLRMGVSPMQALVQALEAKEKK